MPFRSKAQARWMFARHPKMARRWAGHTEDIESLPDHVSTSKEASMDPIAQLATLAAERPFLDRLSTDTGLSHDQIRHLASVVEVRPALFCKQAYADPHGFNALVGSVKRAGPRTVRNAYGSLLNDGTVLPPVGRGAAGGGGGGALIPSGGGGGGGGALIPSGGGGGGGGLVPSGGGGGGGGGLAGLLAGPGGGSSGGGGGSGGVGSAGSRHVGGDYSIVLPDGTTIPGGGGASGGGAAAAKGKPGMGARAAQGFNRASGATGRGISTVLQKLFGKGLSPRTALNTGRVALPAAGLLAAGGLAGGLLGRSSPESAPAAPTPAAVPPPAVLAAAGAGGGAGGAGGAGGLSGLSGAIGGLSPNVKALLAAGGLAGAGYGASRLLGRKKKRDKEAADRDLRILSRAVMNKVASLRRQQARSVMTHYLDKLASHLPLEKQARLRVLQAGLCHGNSLSMAIKLAYPQLAGEQRGILAARLVKAAHAAQKRANMGAMGGGGGGGIPTQEPMSQTGPAGNMGSMMEGVGLGMGGMGKSAGPAFGRRVSGGTVGAGQTVATASSTPAAQAPQPAQPTPGQPSKSTRFGRAGQALSSAFRHVTGGLSE